MEYLPGHQRGFLSNYVPRPSRAQNQTCSRSEAFSGTAGDLPKKDTGNQQETDFNHHQTSQNEATATKADPTQLASEEGHHHWSSQWPSIRWRLLEKPQASRKGPPPRSRWCAMHMSMACHIHHLLWNTSEVGMDTGVLRGMHPAACFQCCRRTFEVIGEAR